MLRNFIGIEISKEYYQMVKDQVKPIELFLLDPTSNYGEFKPARRNSIR